MEIINIVNALVDVGLPAILMYQLLVVWNRLVVVTDKLISLNAQFEEYREASEAYRAEVRVQLEGVANDRR